MLGAIDAVKEDGTGVNVVSRATHGSGCGPRD